MQLTSASYAFHGWFHDRRAEARTISIKGGGSSLRTTMRSLRTAADTIVGFFLSILLRSCRFLNLGVAPEQGTLDAATIPIPFLEDTSKEGLCHIRRASPLPLQYVVLRRMQWKLVGVLLYQYHRPGCRTYEACCDSHEDGPSVSRSPLYKPFPRASRMQTEPTIAKCVMLYFLSRQSNGQMTKTRVPKLSFQCHSSNIVLRS